MDIGKAHCDVSGVELESHTAEAVVGRIGISGVLWVVTMTSSELLPKASYVSLLGGRMALFGLCFFGSDGPSPADSSPSSQGDWTVSMSGTFGEVREFS